MPKKVGNVTKVADNKYRIRVAKGRRHDGKPRVVTETFYGTEEAAHIRAAQIAASMGASDVYGDTMTLAGYYWYIFRDKQSARATKRRPATLKYYDNQMDKHILPMLGDIRIGDIKHEQIVCCINESSAPVNTKRTLSVVLRSAFDDGLIEKKPMERRIPVIKKKREQIQPWTRFEAQQAFEKITGFDWRMEIFLILGLSGLRKEETLGVRMKDVRVESTYSIATGQTIETMTISVCCTYTETDGLVEQTKNEQSARRVPVYIGGRERLKTLMRIYAEVGATPDTRLIDMPMRTFMKRWKRTLNKLGIRYIPPKMLRHTTDTLMLTAGVPSDINDKLHGRSQHSSTYQSYLRPDLGVMEDAMNKMYGVMNKNER